MVPSGAERRSSGDGRFCARTTSVGLEGNVGVEVGFCVGVVEGSAVPVGVGRGDGVDSKVGVTVWLLEAQEAIEIARKTMPNSLLCI